MFICLRWTQRSCQVGQLILFMMVVFNLTLVRASWAMHGCMCLCVCVCRSLGEASTSYQVSSAWSCAASPSAACDAHQHTMHSAAQPETPPHPQHRNARLTPVRPHAPPQPHDCHQVRLMASKGGKKAADKPAPVKAAGGAPRVHTPFQKLRLRHPRTNTLSVLGDSERDLAQQLLPDKPAVAAAGEEAQGPAGARGAGGGAGLSAGAGVSSGGG